MCEVNPGLIKDWNLSHRGTEVNTFNMSSFFLICFFLHNQWMLYIVIIS